jgi:hypothetical protein
VAISIFIIVISTALFVYWFRYTCVLILRTRDARDYAQHVAEVNHLTFLTAQQQLAGTQDKKESFDKLHESLDRDYRVISYLLRHAGTQNGQSIEEFMLRVDYQIMRGCYFLSRPFSASSARRFLAERASIISHLANAMGERVSISS